MHQVHQFPHQRQADSRPPDGLPGMVVGLVKVVKDQLLLGGGNADAGVAYPDLHHGVSGVGGVFGELQFQAHFAPGWGELQGI